LRSDTAGQYLEIGTWVVGIVDGRIAPDGFGKYNHSFKILYYLQLTIAQKMV